MRIWFNKSLSGTHHLVRALKEDASIEVIASHNTSSAMLVGADQAFMEQKHLGKEAYVEWALGFAKEHRVDVFVPGKEAARIAEARALFVARGVHLLVAAEPEILRLLQDKARFYSTFDREIAKVLEFRTVTTLAGFKAAYEELSAGGNVCMKPASGMFGSGFRSLTASHSLRRILEGDLTSMSLNEAHALLGAAEPFPPMLVMRHAEGAERSIDCLGLDGALVRAVVRRKQSGSSTQVLEENPGAIEIARRATQKYGLTGIYNVQIKDAGGEPHILEINPRPSGGIHVAMASGLNFPLWAIRLLLRKCEPSDVPVPRTGLHVAQISQAVVLPQ